MTDIEKGIPIPSKRKAKYPELFSMEVGDSFARPVEEQTALNSACQYVRREKGYKYSVHNQGHGIVRVWRVA